MQGSIMTRGSPRGLLSVNSFSSWSPHKSRESVVRFNRVLPAGLIRVVRSEADGRPPARGHPPCPCAGTALGEPDANG